MYIKANNFNTIGHINIGFLSSGDPIVSGNRAMHDILAAVLTFHGIGQDFRMDTSRITLMGFGTGAAIVNLLMAAPPSLRKDLQLSIEILN